MKVKAIGALTTQDAAGINKTGKEEMPQREEKMETDNASETDILSKVCVTQLFSTSDVSVGFDILNLDLFPR